MEPEPGNPYEVEGVLNPARRRICRTRWFRRLTGVPRGVHPVIGGAATGSIAVAALAFFHLNAIAGDPYKTLTRALTGKMTVTAIAEFCFLKLAATVSSYSSGGSDGIFAQALFMGAMLGGSDGYLDVIEFHRSSDPIGASACVGMGTAFACIVRAPTTSVLIIFEMTAGYVLVLPPNDREDERLGTCAPLAAHPDLRSVTGSRQHLPASWWWPR